MQPRHGDRHGHQHRPHEPRVGAAQAVHHQSTRPGQQGQQRQAWPAHVADGGDQNVQPLQAAPLQGKWNGDGDDEQAQAVAGGYQIGAGVLPLGKQGHLRRGPNRPREVAGRPQHRSGHAVHTRRVQAVEPRAKAPAQQQRPPNAQHDGPPQAAHERRHLGREVQAQRGANRPLPAIAQRPPAFGGRTGHGQHGRGNQGTQHPGQWGVQRHTGSRSGPGQQQGARNAEQKFRRHRGQEERRKEQAAEYRAAGAGGEAVLPTEAVHPKKECGRPV